MFADIYKKLSGLAQRACLPTDSDAERTKKGVLTLVAGFIVIAAVIWGIIYLSLGYFISACIPLSYAVISIISIIYFFSTKKFAFFRFSQLLLVLWLPFLLQWSLGGFSNGSVVMIWGFFTPLAAMLFADATHATKWLFAFLALAIFSGLIDSRIQSIVPPMDMAPNISFFVLNMGVGCVGIFIVLNYFVTERESSLTQLSIAMDRLKESQLQLIQAEKMASLGQMVAGIAHEINTPLAYVKGGLEILNTRMGDIGALVNETTELGNLMSRPESSKQVLASQLETVNEITSAFAEADAMTELGNLLKDGLHGIGQISEIVLNLKNFSRLDRAKVDRFNVNDGIASTLNIARSLVKHRRIETRFGEVPTVLCSPSQINQVFLNLINNACQATSDKNGMITISTRSIKNGVAVDIRDNGVGIPVDVLPKIFDPFFTTKKVGEGTGLGLSIIQRIVQEHGGKIKVVSKVGVGSIFTVLLPLERRAVQVLAS